MKYNRMDLITRCHSRESGNPTTMILFQLMILDSRLGGDDNRKLEKILISNISGYNKKSSFSFKSEALGERHA